MKGERLVAGLRCSEVLADLSDFIDGSLDAERIARLQGHVAGCQVCERFGATFKTAVRALRELRAPPDVDPAIAKRLRDALHEL